MVAPFVVIRTFTIQPSKLEGFKQYLKEFFPTIEAKEPRLLALNAYINDAGSEVTFIHIHPDAASMELHENVAREHTERARREFLNTTTSLQVYGAQSDFIREKTRQLAAKGSPLNTKPQHVGGFTRLAEKR